MSHFRIDLVDDVFNAQAIVKTSLIMSLGAKIRKRGVASFYIYGLSTNHMTIFSPF